MQHGTEKEEKRLKSVNPGVKGKLQSWLYGFTGLVVVVFGALWIMQLINQVIMPLVVRSGVELTVPDLRELPVKKAEDICTEMGIELVRERNRVDNNHRSGIVLDQFPLAGSIVKPNRRISVVLSVRESLVLCPRVIGKSPREAELIADSCGLKLGTERIQYRHSTEIPEGAIMAQYPAPMTGLISSDSLSITVSLGPVPTKIIVPNLVGKHIDETELALKKFKLKTGRITRYPHRSVREGEILEQSPPAGTEMKPGGAVDVTIAVPPVDAQK